MRVRLRYAIALIGPKALFSLVLASLGAFLLAAVELGIALFLQLFLQSLGLLSDGVGAPPWLTRLLPSAWHAGLALAAIGLLRAISQLLVGQATSVAHETTTRRLRLLSVYELLLHPARPYVPMSRLTLQLGEHFVKAGYFAYGFAGLVGQAVQALILTLVLFFVAPKESALAFTGLAFTGMLVRSLQRRSRDYARRVPDELSAVAQGIERIGRNLFLVRALRTEVEEHRRFRRGIDDYAEYAISAGFWGTLSSVVAPLAGTFLIVIIVFVSKGAFFTPSLVLLSFLYLFVRFTQAVAASVAQAAMCTQYAPQFAACVAYVERLGLDAVRAATAVEPPVPQRRTDASPPPRLTFTALAFRYSDEASWVFQGLDCSIGEGEQYAITGPSGAGKSTLLSLLLGITEPTHGSVLIDGKHPRDYFAEGHAVGYVGAEAYLVAGSVADNLRYGLAADVPVTDDALWNVLERVRLRDTIAAKPGGLSHAIREDGAGLSAGQKQRLCLARALLSKPGLLVLDEASANIDEKTEGELAEMLRALKGSVTTIIVSHRPLLVKYADQRMELSASAS